MKRVVKKGIGATADRISPEIVLAVRENIAKQMIGFIEDRIARNFPKDLDRVCEHFFTLEVEPHLQAFLTKRKKEIIKRIEAQMVGIAAQKVIREFSNALDRKEMDFGYLDD